VRSERKGTIGTWLLLLAKAAVGGIAEVENDAGTVLAGDNSREGVSLEVSEDGTFGTGDRFGSGGDNSREGTSVEWSEDGTFGTGDGVGSSSQVEEESGKDAKQGWPEVV
jgi:hypothetical protein